MKKQEEGGVSKDSCFEFAFVHINMHELYRPETAKLEHWYSVKACEKNKQSLEILMYFIQVIKTEYDDIIGDKVFSRKLIRFPRKKGIIRCILFY